MSDPIRPVFPTTAEIVGVSSDGLVFTIANEDGNKDFVMPSDGQCMFLANERTNKVVLFTSFDPAPTFSTDMKGIMEWEDVFPLLGGKIPISFEGKQSDAKPVNVKKGEVVGSVNAGGTVVVCAYIKRSANEAPVKETPQKVFSFITEQKLIWREAPPVVSPPKLEEKKNPKDKPVDEVKENQKVVDVPATNIQVKVPTPDGVKGFFDKLSNTEKAIGAFVAYKLFLEK